MGGSSRALGMAVIFQAGVPPKPAECAVCARDSPWPCCESELLKSCPMLGVNAEVITFSICVCRGSVLTVLSQ